MAALMVNENLLPKLTECLHKTIENNDLPLKPSSAIATIGDFVLAWDDYRSILNVCTTKTQEIQVSVAFSFT
jgi:hypothetical protein